jgi:transglutaminase-like putative cysteine protease
MLILSEFDIRFQIPAPAAMVVVLHLHPSIESRVRTGNELLIERSTADVPDSTDHPRTIVPYSEYFDSFGNRCARFIARAGYLRLSNTSVIDTDPEPDRIYAHARQAPIEDLPSEVLQFLLPSRYCEVDRFAAIAQDLFGSITPGWNRAVAIRDWVHGKVIFNYNAARPTKTSMDVFAERTGVCRDFQHLAITLSRCQNIPARMSPAISVTSGCLTVALETSVPGIKSSSTASGSTSMHVTITHASAAFSWPRGAMQPMLLLQLVLALRTSLTSMSNRARSIPQGIGFRAFHPARSPRRQDAAFPM